MQCHSFFNSRHDKFVSRKLAFFSAAVKRSDAADEVRLLFGHFFVYRGKKPEWKWKEKGKGIAFKVYVCKEGTKTVRKWCSKGLYCKRVQSYDTERKN